MTGKTHLAVGTAAALCVTQPPHLRDWVLCIGAAVVGSVISDVVSVRQTQGKRLIKLLQFPVWHL